MPLFGPPSVRKLKAKNDTAGLLKALRNHQDADVRRDAAVALGEMADAQAIGPLIGTLRDPDPAVVQAAIGALVKFGADALAPLLVALGDQDFNTRAASAWALGQISEVLDDKALRWRCTELLIASLRDDHELVREAAARALARTADPGAMTPLRDALGDGQPVVRVAAAFALAQIGLASSDKSVRKQAVGQLVLALDDSDIAVRQTAARAIGEIGAQLQNGLLKDSVMMRLGAALKDREPAVRSSVAGALGSIGDARAVRPLFSVLLSQDTENELIRRCLEAIVRIGAPAINELTTLLLDKDRAVRDQAATVLDQLGWSPDSSPAGAAYWLSKRNWDKCVDMGVHAADVLAAELDSDDYETRVHAGQALVAIGEPACPAVLKILVTGDASLRERAVSLLDQIGWEPSSDEVGAVYWVSKGCWDRAVELGDVSINPLVRALRDGDFETRQSAASALEALHWQPTEPQDQIDFAVMAHHWDVCREIGGPVVEPLITTVLLHDDEGVKREAAGVLIELAESETLEDEYRERLLSKYDVIIVPYCAGHDTG